MCVCVRASVCVVKLISSKTWLYCILYCYFKLYCIKFKWNSKNVYKISDMNNWKYLIITSNKSYMFLYLFITVNIGELTIKEDENSWVCGGPLYCSRTFRIWALTMNVHICPPSCCYGSSNNEQILERLLYRNEFL